MRALMAWRLSPESIARRCSRRPWLTIGVWLLVVLFGGWLATRVLGGVLTTEGNFVNSPESKRADQLLEQRLRGPRRANEIVVVRSEAFTVDDAEFRTTVERLAGSLSALGSDVILFTADYYRTRESALVSADRHATLLPVIMAGTLDDASDNIQQLRRVVEAANGQGGFEVLITGMASLNQDFQEIAERDLRAGELFGIPIGLVILVLVFGAVGAALLPLVLAGLSIVVALGLSALVGQAFSLSFFVTNMITMMGLAVGIDYSLFLVERYREERRRGLPKSDAIARASATAGRTVLFSGLTVVLALFGMVIVPTTVFRSLGVGAILVVVSAVLASLTLLPALLSVLGDRVNALSVPFFGRRPSAGQETEGKGFWVHVARMVMAWPVPSLLVTAALLIAASVPYFDIQTGGAGVRTLPERIESKKAFVVLAREFSFNLVTPAEIVIAGEVNSPAVQAGTQRLREALARDASFGVPRLVANPGGDLALLSVPLTGDSFDPRTIDAVRRLRSTYVPQAFSGVPAEVLVTGMAAFNLDFFNLTGQFTPVVFTFVLGLSLLLLLVVFRSIVVPLKAILMNLLSVGASYGLLVLVFQKGVGIGLLGFQRAETIEAWIPLFLFAVLFGLSMDYHVFLLSRIREHYDQTLDNAQAVAFGLRSTGRLITGAALIMVAVFATFAKGELVMFQQVCFGLAAAVLLDATIVRSVLVPASMKLLGSVNWYLPGALRWLPDLRAGPAEQTAASVESEPLVRSPGP